MKWNVVFINYDWSEDDCGIFNTEAEANEYVEDHAWEETQEAYFEIREIED